MAENFRNKGLDVHAMKLDQSDHNSVMDLKGQILKKFGRLDVFVNNAVSRLIMRVQIWEIPRLTIFFIMPACSI